MRKDKAGGSEAAAELTKLQALLKQRDAAVGALSAQLDAVRSKGGGAQVVPALLPRPLSRSNSEASREIGEENNAAAHRIKQLEVREGRGFGGRQQSSLGVGAGLAPSGTVLCSCDAMLFSAVVHPTAPPLILAAALQEELASAQSRLTEMTPRRLTRRESVEESGMSVVGGGGLSSFEANRVRSLRAEAESWKDRSESLMNQNRELQRQQQAADIEKARLADSAAMLSEKAAGLEAELRAAREQLASLRAGALLGRRGQGRGGPVAGR